MNKVSYMHTCKQQCDTPHCSPPSCWLWKEPPLVHWCRIMTDRKWGKLRHISWQEANRHFSLKEHLRSRESYEVAVRGCFWHRGCLAIQCERVITNCSGIVLQQLVEFSCQKIRDEYEIAELHNTVQLRQPHDDNATSQRGESSRTPLRKRWSFTLKGEWRLLTLTKENHVRTQKHFMK